MVWCWQGEAEVVGGGVPEPALAAVEARIGGAGKPARKLRRLHRTPCGLANDDANVRLARPQRILWLLEV